ncbi:MAG: glycoside hydrolase family 32 protein [Planctomycetota bacterium]|nr:glycoside hydrolase family 32 protein [Planctomycetota bacterium]
MPKATLYHEALRPQFHFTPRVNWTNDPNGLVYYKGEYHMFFQLNAKGINWGPNTRGHAVSRDLVHWKQIDDAIKPDTYGWIWSGSAVVDWENTAGLQKGREKTLVAIYTTGGILGTAGCWEHPTTPAVQAIAYSNDRGRTWTKYKGNPVLGWRRGANRDPKVLWHAPTRTWIMALYMDENDFALFGSKNLTQWDRLQDIHLCGSSECPDFFELPVDGKAKNTRWVFWGGDSKYLIGQFDGRTFTKEGGQLSLEQGPNGYAAQTWSDVPAEDGRRIQISWMRDGKYPAMPFNQQMTCPAELTRKTFPEGIRLCREPVREIETLRGRQHRWAGVTMKPGKNLVVPTKCDLFDVEVDVKLGDVSEFCLFIQGHALRYNVAGRKFLFLNREVHTHSPAGLAGGRLQFRLLVDRTSVELFHAGGKTTASFCYLPAARDWPLEFYLYDGSAKVVSLRVHELKSIWR